MRRTVAYVIHNPVLALFDVLLVNVSWILSFHLRWIRLTPHASNVQAYVREIPLLSIAAITIFFLCDLYSGWLRKSKTELAYSVASASLLIALATTAIAFWDRRFAFPRSVILISCVITCIAVLGFRLVVQRVRRAAFAPARALFVCNNIETGKEIASQINAVSHAWVHVKAILEAKDLIRFYEVQPEFDTVIVAGTVGKKAEIIDYCASCKQDVMVIPDFFELSMVGARPMHVDDILLFNVRPPHLSPGQRMLKRILDLLGSAALIIATSPFLLALPILIRLSSKGPALFKQDRVGRDGKEYTVYKFRTMVDDAERHSGPVLATEDDPRITRLGKFLRDTRLDELPQLFNVLKGDMSLVGPRPERAHFVREFSLTVPSYQYRHLVKPGITGMAQVYGRYSTMPARKLGFDLMYIYDYSLVLDLKLLLMTVLVVLKRKQAAGVSHRPSETSVEHIGAARRRAPGQEIVFEK
jgi:exopolysaccharide biosynthesis polyprenyl glycosylphosphotransferase